MRASSVVNCQWTLELAHFSRHAGGELIVFLCVDLRLVHSCVSQGYRRCFEAKLLPNSGSRRVPKPVGGPNEFGSPHCRSALTPALFWLWSGLGNLSQFLRHFECPFTRTCNRTPIRIVGIPGARGTHRAATGCAGTIATIQWCRASFVASLPTLSFGLSRSKTEFLGIAKQVGK